jgi:hypothetical protein
MKQLLNNVTFVYVDVIYFFTMHEIYAHTIFEPLVKKHLPFFSCFMKKTPHSKAVVRQLLKGFSKTVLAEGLLRASVYFHSSNYCQRFASCSIFVVDAV